jgi:AcrR family transcriptional regulator
MGRRAETTQRILDGAAAAFVKAGYAATSMEQIAAAAGVSKLLLYRDFAGKRELYQAVLERTVLRLRERVPEVSTAQAVRDMVAAARADPDGFTLMFRHASREPEFAGYADQITAWAIRETDEVLRRFEPDPMLRGWAAEMTVTMTFQFIISWLERGDPGRDEDFCQRLLAATRALRKPAGK